MPRFQPSIPIATYFIHVLLEMDGVMNTNTILKNADGMEVTVSSSICIPIATQSILKALGMETVTEKTISKSVDGTQVTVIRTTKCIPIATQSIHI